MRKAKLVEIEKTKARFILDNAAKKSSYVMLLVTCEDERLRYSSGEKVSPNFWDKDRQRSGNGRIDTKLHNLQTWVDSYFLTCQHSNTPFLKDNLRKYLMEKEGKEVKAKFTKGDFYTGIDQVIDLARKKVILFKKRAYSAGTIRNWEKTKNTLYRFDPTLSFEKITMQTYDAFVQWCFAQKTKKDLLYSYNYIGALIKDWKSLMELAMNRGYHTNRIHRDKDFIQITEKPHKVDLNDDEILKLKKVELSGSLEEIRDRFLINLYLGLRISDFQKLNEKNIEGDFVKVSTTQKTGSSALMDLDPEIKEVIAKYGGKLPTQYNKEYVNREIKKIAKKAGITSIVEFEETRGGETILVRKPKCDMISHHTCRRSAVTNLKRMGIGDKEISITMGVSVKTLQNHYILLTPEETAAMIADRKRQNRAVLKAV